MSSEAPVPNAEPKGAGKAGKAGPPPAPKGAGKGPPPPAKGSGKGKGPPMMPGGAVARLPEASGPKLRPLFWSVVNQVSPDSVFSDLCEPAPFDKGMLERQFTIADSRTPMSCKSANGAGSRSGSEEPRKRLRVLDDRSSQMLAIAFRRLPPPDQLAEMVDSLEDFPEGITSEGVIALHSAMSEHKEAVEQIRLVVTNPDAMAQLDMPEKFLLRLSSVPSCSVKLACGKLIVGSAKELTDLRMNGQKVGVCCQEIRKSKLLQKWISTSFAVGNMLNRGTSRSGVRAVVLPESLLKLEELRGCAPSDDGGDAEKDKGPSALDFVAQALVDQEGVKEGQYLREVESLLAKARAAASVSLEETQTNCRQVNAEASEARKGLADLQVPDVPLSPGMARMVERVGTICEEASLAVCIAEKAKDQLAKAQAWSSCKGKVNSNDWFASWVQLLELLPRALGRAEEAKVRRLALEEAARLAQEEAAAAEAARKARERPPLAETNEDPLRRRFQENLEMVKSALEKKSPAKSPGVKKSPAKSPEVLRDLGVPRHYPKENFTEASQNRSSNLGGRSGPKVRDDEAKMDSIDWDAVNKLSEQQGLLQENQQPEAKKPCYKPSRASISAMWDQENSAFF